MSRDESPTPLAERWPQAPLDLPADQLTPQLRSAAGRILAGHAGLGRLHLQVCGGCGQVQYPPRDVCVACLDGTLDWQDVATGARLVSCTTLHHSHFPYFQARLPWRIAMVRLDCGPAAVVHVDEVCKGEPGERLTVTLRRDGGGMAVLFGQPESMMANKDES
ncbi:Zn-ribbon domain-containing OB-fold protein [Kerstersia similis]|uniref:Zn-ribbon domain-containing OB-fold protein n=1 Tax=Kerstersia similis TaxID=206505 RepID=UPI0039F0C584